MSVLVVGISHKSAPVALLERLALDSEARAKLLHDLLDSEHISEAAVVATCNRLEVYTDVDRFHGIVEEVSATITSLAPGRYRASRRSGGGQRQAEVLEAEAAD